MGIAVGKILMEVAKTALRCTLTAATSLYVSYRINGGPPIRELYRSVKTERENAEAAAQKQFKGKIVLENGEYHVR